MITLYGYPQSRSFRVLWMLEELNVDYQYETVDLMAGEGHKPAFQKINLTGKVPAIRENDFILTESAAICTWLGDKFPEKRLVPVVGGEDRARYNEWCFYILAELEQPLWTLGKHRFVFPEERRVSAIMETAHWEFANAVDVLQVRLGKREFALADRFSAIDILIAHTLRWAEAFGVPVGYSSLNDYRDRMLARSACKVASTRDAEAKEEMDG